MLLAEAVCLLTSFILQVSAIQGQADRICALKGSSVDLLCSAENPSAQMKWYTVRWNGPKYVLNIIPQDGNPAKYNVSAERNFSLTLNNLTESDANIYCCKETTDTLEKCRESAVQLRVADLQVQVIPTTEGQTVTLMCSTSCALTETPAVYIWYKNRESLYQDWSPWYQELVSSEEAVRYSCAIEGYEDLRAPEVSVDSVTSTCFSVTYAKGRMCSYYQTSEDEPCSITHPREVYVQKSPAGSHVSLSCNTSCPLTAHQPAYKGYKNRNAVESFTCAIKGAENLRSAEVCINDSNCWSVNYMSRRICALEGSSVNISCEYSHPENLQPKSKFWYKIKRAGKKPADELTEAAGRVEYHEAKNNRHILNIKNLKKNDSAEYLFRLITKGGEYKQSGLSVALMTVTGLKVKFAPSAVVTEDQRVTLTCSTSCPLTNNTNYIWFFNSRPLTLTEHQNKHLVLDPVSSQHAGNYSCAAKTQTDIRSPAETLTVERKSMSVMNMVRLAAVLLLTVFNFYLLIRKKTNILASLSASDRLEIGQVEEHTV